MKITTYFIYFFSILLNNQLFSQNYFERLLPWQGDTSNVAIEVVQKVDGSFVILTRLSSFAKINGVPIHGWYFYGNGLMWADENGEPTTYRHYQTNFDLQYGCTNWGSTLACNANSTNDIAINQSGNIVLPVATFGGYNTCGTIETAQREVFIHTINDLNGNIVHSNHLLPDSAVQCIRHFGMTDYRLNEDGTAIILVKDFYNNDMRIYKVEQDFSFTPMGSFPDSVTQYDYAYFGTIDRDSNYVWYPRKSTHTLEKYNYLGELLQSLPIGNEISISRVQKVEFQDDLIIFLQTGSGVIPPSTSYKVHSVMNIFTRAGDLYARKVFEERRIYDFSITNSGDILLLENLWVEGDTIEKKIVARKYSIELEELGSSPPLGYNFVEGVKIKVLDDDAYLILGTQKTSFIDDTTKQKDEVYLAKQPISEIALSALEVNKAKYEIQISPNPSANIFTIQCRDCTLQRVELFDALGRLILQEIITNSYHQIDLGHLASGIYYLKMYDKDEQHVSAKKLVKY